MTPPPEQGQPETTDPKAEARAKRAAEREARVESGIAELRLWLEDLIRQGLAGAASRPYRFWDDAAARLVDAQAPGLARQVRDLAGIPASGEGWPERLLERLSRILLIVEAYERIGSLPPEQRADLRTAVGFTERQEGVLARDGVVDRWLVAGRIVEDQDPLRVQRTWLLGTRTGRTALLLTYAHVSQPLDLSLAPGTVLETAVSFYPGAWPLRALVRGRETEHVPPSASETSTPASASDVDAAEPGDPAASASDVHSAEPGDPAASASDVHSAEPGDPAPSSTLTTPAPVAPIPGDPGPEQPPLFVPGAASIGENLSRYSRALGANPWIEQVPFALEDVLPIQEQGRWRVRDAQLQLELPPGFTAPWELLALSGGRPVTMFGEWDGACFLPLSVLAEGRFVPLNVGL